jgi:hypothetical protein
VFILKKKSLLQKQQSPISINLGTNHPWVKGILNYSNQGPGPIQRGDNHKTAKMGWGHFKNVFLRTTELEELTFT